MDGIGLDQSQVADAINRKYQGMSQRERNQKMAQAQSGGASQFQSQYGNELAQAQQPTEFWGAGRKLAENQAPDESAVNAAGGTLATLGGQKYYYGDTDLSSAQWGTGGYNTSDIGGGKYNILGKDGGVLGTGYKSLQDTIKEMGTSKYTPVASQWWNQLDQLPDNAYSTNRWGLRSEEPDNAIMQQLGLRYNPDYQSGFSNLNLNLPQQSQYQQLTNGFSVNGSNYNSVDEANAAAQNFINNRITGNSTRDWETLGQLLTQGGITGDFNTPHAIGGNNINDQITGLNTLYGSTPLIANGKVVGYKQNGQITPLSDSWNQQNTESTKSSWLKAGKTTNTWDVGYAGMGRQYNNPDWWSQNVRGLGDSNYFITPEMAAQSPGWGNNDAFQRDAGSQSQKNGAAWFVPGAVGNRLFGNSFHEDVGKILDPILNFFIPTFGGTTRVGRATDALGNGGSFGDSYKAATADGWAGAGRSLLSGLISYGVAGADPGGNVGLTGYAAQAANGAMSAGLGSLVNGQGAEKSLIAALAGGAGGAAGGAVGNATQSLGKGLSGFLSGAAQGAVSGLKDPKHMLESALTSGASGGLGGIFNQGVSNPETIRKNQQAAKTAVSLANTLRKVSK